MRASLHHTDRVVVDPRDGLHYYYAHVDTIERLLPFPMLDYFVVGSSAARQRAALAQVCSSARCVWRQYNHNHCLGRIVFASSIGRYSLYCFKMKLQMILHDSSS
jgi:hypothetical protein